MSGIVTVYVRLTRTIVGTQLEKWVTRSFSMGDPHFWRYSEMNIWVTRSLKPALLEVLNNEYIVDPQFICG